MAAYTLGDALKTIRDYIGAAGHVQSVTIGEPKSPPAGDDIVAAVENVLGRVHEECVAVTPSSGGKYTSVRVGPVWVQSGEQVIAVFAAIKADARVKWYM